MTSGLWVELNNINRAVNARIHSARDDVLHGIADHWTEGQTEGDCEDYAIAKKQALIAAGWSADQLLYAVVEGPQTPFHAVLLVRTSEGDVILDNLTEGILTARESGYRFIARQSMSDPYRWVSLAQGPAESMSVGHIITR
jgi:predicted transglutaminase-like cysteine proteinase